MGGRQAKLSLTGLFRLTEMVEDLGLGRKLDSSSAMSKIEEETEHKSSQDGTDTSKPVADAAKACVNS